LLRSTFCSVTSQKNVKIQAAKAMWSKNNWATTESKTTYKVIYTDYCKVIVGFQPNDISPQPKEAKVAPCELLRKMTQTPWSGSHMTLSGWGIFCGNPYAACSLTAVALVIVHHRRLRERRLNKSAFQTHITKLQDMVRNQENGASN